MGNRTAATKGFRARAVVFAILALLLATICPVAQAEGKTQSSAGLRIEVNVIPMVQAAAMAQASPTSYSNDAVSFNLNQQVVLKSTQEVSEISPASNGSEGFSSAVLETVTTVVQ